MKFKKKISQALLLVLIIQSTIYSVGQAKNIFDNSHVDFDTFGSILHEKLLNPDKSWRNYLLEITYKLQGYGKDSLQLKDIVDKSVSLKEAMNDEREEDNLNVNLGEQAELYYERNQKYFKNGVKQVLQIGQWQNLNIQKPNEKKMSKIQAKVTTNQKYKFNKQFREQTNMGMAVALFQKHKVENQYYYQLPNSDNSKEAQATRKTQKYKRQLKNKGKKYEQNRMAVVMLDGQYSNRISNIYFPNPFNLDVSKKLGKDGLQSTQTIYNKLGEMRTYHNFWLVKLQRCRFDFHIEYTKVKDQNGRDNFTHTITIRNSADNTGGEQDKQNNNQKQQKCFEDNVGLKISVHSTKESIISKIQSRGVIFTLVASILLCIVMSQSGHQTEKFYHIHEQRFNDPSYHGRNMMSYASQFNLCSSYIIFWANFVLFFIYFQLGLSGTLGSLFFFPMFMQFVNCFFFQSRIITFHIRIMAFDRYQDIDNQQKEISNRQCGLYMFCFFSSLFVFKIVTSKIWIFIGFSSLWLPQIYQNTMSGQRNVPTFAYAASQTLNIIFLPLYLKVVDGNFMYLRPNYLFFFITMAWIVFQMLILFIQQNRPRFFLPQSVRESLQDDYYKYQHNFVDDAARSSSTYLSDRVQDQRRDFSVMDDDERQGIAEKRLGRMLEEECTICMVGLGTDQENERPIDDFFKTPCNHRFHKKCLLNWLNQRFQCPVCRQELPQYIDPDDI